ncbi:MAG: peptidylprolyl isomerase [Candidatus Omnitrophota bacterium]|nr:MAG: peptidylprolyl isomerase [Candidatus Omnitrophota bacterium]
MDEPDFHEALYNLACCLAATGDKDNALGYLSRACNLSLECIDWAKEDTEFDEIRDLPIFQKIVVGASREGPKEEEVESGPLDFLRAIIETDKGIIRLKLFGDQTPITVTNFVNLALRGFYDNLIFHRVVPNFMIQTGCPLGKGTGGPGYKFKDEFVAGLNHSKPGMLSMANSGPNTNGSQFFITHKATAWLDRKHTIFGEVIAQSDQNVVDQIVQGDPIRTIQIQGNSNELREKYHEKIDEWNKILDRNYPNLRI